MSGINFTTASTPTADRVLSGGLFSSAGSRSLQKNESSDLQNIDFD